MKIFLRKILIKLLIYLTGENYCIIENKNRNFTIVCQEVERYYLTPLETLISKTKKTPICERRQILQVLALEHTSLNKSEIGKLTGRDHCAVIHAQKTISNLMSTEETLATDYSIINKRIKKRIRTLTK
jgi:chromosomal replication initiation ATPase DnaA